MSSGDLGFNSTGSQKKTEITSENFQIRIGDELQPTQPNPATQPNPVELPEREQPNQLFRKTFVEQQQLFTTTSRRPVPEASSRRFAQTCCLGGSGCLNFKQINFV